MIKSFELVDFLEEQFPYSSLLEWDNAGYSHIGKEDIKKILISLDLTSSILDYAIKNEFDFILNYHTFFFDKISKTKTFKKYPYKRKIFNLIKKHNINVFSVHTNFDHFPNTSVKEMIKKLNYYDTGIQAIDNFNAIIHLNKAKNFFEIVADYKNIFALKSLQSNLMKNKKIRHFTILPGSAGMENIINAIKIKKTDLYITSDLKWSEQITLNEKKINFLLVPHLVEQFILEYFKKQIIQKFFDKIEVEIKFIDEIIHNV
ncbi:Nif3-like dinuclear metal center hexameric protein [[Mycoplasma] collis]|uniref:Nif3-like dinuclear metal center hexameric protein n=1 Tax=[Mycoplasma] collis TaxID=2127 RepID=UPI00051C284B|nr:Nif3-like dinuclear metal center hexameric protein [[Mycoplasma] collis]